MLKLTKDKVGIIPIFDADKSKGGIWIPDEAKERSKQGIVKYVGPDVSSISIGSYVVYSGYTGQLLNIEGEGKLIIMPEEFVVAEILDEDIMLDNVYMRVDVELDELPYHRAPLGYVLEEAARQFKQEGRQWKIKTITKPTSKEYDKMRAT